MCAFGLVELQCPAGPGEFAAFTGRRPSKTISWLAELVAPDTTVHCGKRGVLASMPMRCLATGAMAWTLFGAEQPRERVYPQLSAPCHTATTCVGSSAMAKSCGIAPGIGGVVSR